jgi:hypothetical protein
VGSGAGGDAGDGGFEDGRWVGLLFGWEFRGHLLNV